MDPLVPMLYVNFISNQVKEPNYFLISVIILLILCGAFFSSVETALTCSNIALLKTKEDNGSKSAKLVLKILDKYDQSLITILIGNNVLRMVSSSVATIFAVSLLPHNEPLATTISVIVMTLVVFLFGETIPKNIAKANPEKMSQLFAYPLYAIYIVTYPIMQVFNFILWIFKKIFKMKEEDAAYSEDDFQGIVEDAQEEGVIDNEEKDIIQAAVEFNDITVKSVLTPKDKMVLLDYRKMSRAEILKSISEIKYTRIPVYQNNIDNIIGIFNVRKFVKLAINSKKFAFKTSMSEVINVNDNTPLDDMVKLFKEKKSHMAIVRNDNNELIGLVTMEDVLEELVGESLKDKEVSAKELSPKGGTN